MKLKEVKTLIEYNGDLYTAEELMEETGFDGDFEIVVSDKETWFTNELLKLRDTSKDQ